MADGGPRGALIAAVVIAAVLLAGCATGPLAAGSASTAHAPAAPASTTAAPASAPASGVPASAAPAPGRPAIVTFVVDGDTIHARVGSADEKVRIIGLDSPETSKPDTPVECMATAATAEARKLLPVGAPIRLEADATQATRDRYGRLLAHVWLPDGRLFAEVMIGLGFAVHYVYDGVPSSHADRLAAAEAAAKGASRGLWSPSTCAGNPHQPAATP